jgi:mercuric ion binding protein
VEIIMTHRLVIALMAVLTAVPLAAQAADRTVTLAVHNADCVLCGPIVKKTLERVTGVRAVTVSQADAAATVTARVTFDDTVASVPTLIAASTNAGYPADLAQ